MRKNASLLGHIWSSLFVVHLTAKFTLATRSSTTSSLPRAERTSIILAKTQITTSGLFVDTHGLTCNEPNLTNSHQMAAWTETAQFDDAQIGLRTIIIEPSVEKCTKLHRRSKRSQLEESVGRTTCLLARTKPKTIELSTIKQSNSRVLASNS